MQYRLPAMVRHPRRLRDRRSGRRLRGAHRGVLAAVVALAVGAWVVVVQHQTTPEVDAHTARESLVVLDELLAANGGVER